MERSKVNNILDTNDPMPRNECQKANKSQKTPMKTLYIKTNAELISTKSSKAPLHP